MDFVSRVKELAARRLKLALKYPDERLRVHRNLRLVQQQLWVAATDEDLQRYAEAKYQEFINRGGNVTLAQWLDEAKLARQEAQKRLKNPRCW